MNSRKRLEAPIVNGLFDIYDKQEQYGLKPREGQENMSFDIAEAFKENKNLIVEAGVGIGKSFGYLIPALLIRKYTGKPIVIATSSIQLSEQIYNDALFIANRIGMDIRVVVGKGMTNYACQSKASDIVDNTKSKAAYKEYWTLVEQASEGRLNQRSEVTESIPDHIWNKIAVSNCSFEKCSFKQSCEFYNMRTLINSDTWSIDIIIVNQDLLIRDLIKKYETGKGFITSDNALTVIDEAHNLEEKVRSALTEKFTYKDIQFILKNISSLFDNKLVGIEQYDNLKTLEVAFNEVFLSIDQQLKIADHAEIYTERYPIVAPKQVNYNNVLGVIKAINLTVSLLDVGKRERELDDALMNIRNLEILIEILCECNEDFLIWATKVNERENAIQFCPKNIQEILKRKLFSSGSSVVLTSATLCQAGNSLHEKYLYTARSLGFYGDVSEPKYSPFDYVNNGLMYIANDIPTYRVDGVDNSIQFLNASIERIIELCNITEGRTLVLFSAKEDMKYATDKIKEIQTQWKVVVQKNGSSQESTIQEFRESKGVLFGTGIFWEGINIEGSDLSQVIIVRLPFPVPTDPVLEYKIKTAKDPMIEVLLPEMMIKLRQGTGRLIRSETDKGIISVLDSRLSSKGMFYRSMVLDTLPFKTVTEELSDIKKFANENISSVDRLDIIEEKAG
ncbi:ATP-dependent DNA helicase [Paenibacillus odorifer]|uniref:ATP-dependent DNA helicase n=1 Tax=Paenibacillus odorifer TaxID=189426 RepID=UPI0015C2ED97|nr:ATP-dependent DNA helicase [Paenibacillus odorifer]